MKFTFHLLVFLLMAAIKAAVSQTNVGAIKIDGHSLPIYVQQADIDAIVSKIKANIPPPPVVLPPVVVAPPVVTQTNLTVTSLTIEAIGSIDDGQKKVATWSLIGGSGDYGFKLGSYEGNGTSIWIPLNTTWDVIIFDKNDKTKTVTLKIESKANGEATNIKYNISAPIIENIPPTTQIETQTPIGGNQPLIGAIRWDWWADNFHCTTLWLSPQKWHYKAPFFAKETGNNSLELKGNTQEIFDKELDYAQYAGLDYFAFVWYGNGVDPNALWNGAYGRELFKKSTKKGNMKMAYILEMTNYSPEKLKLICADMGRDDYQKINGRPLFFFMDYPPITPNQVEEINKIYRKLHPTAPLPYIVNTIQVGVQEAQMNNKTGVAAWSQYTGYRQSGDINMRERYKTAGVKLIPTLTVGWDTRPISEQPCSWYQNAPHEPEYRLTGDALKNHLIDTINFVKANPTICEANSILCYAWNENAEGGYIVPTIVPGTSQINTSIIETFHQVLKGQKDQ